MECKDADSPKTTGYVLTSNRIIFGTVVCFLVIALIFVSFDLLFTFTTWVPSITLQKIFDMTRERSVGTWLSVVLSFANGLTLVLIFFVVAAEKQTKMESIGWLILSFFFIYMSVDDCAYIHERIGGLAKRMVSSGALPFGLSRFIDNFPSYYWHLIMGPFFVTMGFFMLCFLWKRFRNTGLLKYLMLSLTGLACAMFLDFAEGISRIVKKLEITTGMSEFSVVHLLRLTEESLEIFSIIVLLYAFLRYLCVILEGRAIVIAR